MRIVEPRDNIYIVPRDCPAERMHYSIVQVSERRYVVAQYCGGAGYQKHPDPRKQMIIPMWEIVSKPMSYLDAESLAIELTHKRTGEQ